MGKTITLKLKNKSFDNHTRSKTLNNYIGSAEEIFEVAKELLDMEVLKEEVRLIGISISSFKENQMEQMSFI